MREGWGRVQGKRGTSTTWPARSCCAKTSRTASTCARRPCCSTSTTSSRCCASKRPPPPPPPGGGGGVPSHTESVSISADTRMTWPTHGGHPSVSHPARFEQVVAGHTHSFSTVLSSTFMFLSPPPSCPVAGSFDKWCTSCTRTAGRITNCSPYLGGRSGAPEAWATCARQPALDNLPYRHPAPSPHTGLCMSLLS